MANCGLQFSYKRQGENKLIKKIANKISNHYIKKGKIKESEKEVYDYYFEIMISTAINIIGLLVLGIVFRLYIEVVCFTIAFMCMRGTSGGYHAKTHIMCFITLIVDFGILIVLFKFVPTTLLFNISIGLSVIAIIIYLILTPVDNINKRLEKEEKVAKRKKSLIFLLAFIIIIIILSIFEIAWPALISVLYVIFSVAVMLIVGTINNSRLYKKANGPRLIDNINKPKEEI